MNTPQAHSDGLRGSANAVPSDVTAPTIERIQYNQKMISSPFDDAPYGLEIVVQTNVTLPRLLLNLHCAKPVLHGEIIPGANYTGMYPWGAEQVPGQPNVFSVTLDLPVPPERPAIVRLYSRDANRVNRIVWSR